MSTLEERLQETRDAQDNNIHLLQTEYHNIEELMHTRNCEPTDTSERLFKAVTQAERMRTYREQFVQLKSVLSDRETELASLRANASASTLLESDTMTLLHHEANQLKQLLFDRENEVTALKEVLEKRSLELAQKCQVIKQGIFSSKRINVLCLPACYNFQISS